MLEDFKKYILYIGTYTNNGSKGIYELEFNTADGKLKYSGSFQNIDNPSYLAVDNQNKYLYAALEGAVIQGQTCGGVAAYSINGKTGRLNFLNCRSSGDKRPCHLITDSSKYLFTANYNIGSISVFRVNTDGSLSSEGEVLHHQGTGPDSERQECAHTHFVTLTPDGKYLCAADLGCDSIISYRYNPQDGQLTYEEKLSCKLRPGFGPRHMIFHPNGKYMYLAGELTSEVAVFEYLENQAELRNIQYISALPQDYCGKSYSSAIRVSPDGKYVYTANRGHDSITIFKVDQLNGRLEFKSTVSTCGEWPRDFIIDPSGRYLVVANEHSGNIVSFRIEPCSGIIEPCGCLIEIPNPTCIQLVTITDIK